MVSQLQAWVSRLDWLALPVLVFLFALWASWWLRRLSFRLLRQWPDGETVEQHTRRPSRLWVLLVGILLALPFLPPVEPWRSLGGRLVGSLLVVSLALTTLRIGEGLLGIYLPRWEMFREIVPGFRQGLRVAVGLLAALVLLEVWGIPLTLLILALLVSAFLLLVLLREPMLDLFSGLQLRSQSHIREGDYIKLESGEEGYVAVIGWNAVVLHTAEDARILVPNARLVRSTVTNYGRPLKRSREPFRFQAHLHLKELTGRRASSLRELVEVLRQAPDAVVYYHTHHFLEEHHFLTPQPANDFAFWVAEALGDEALGEKLSSVDTFAFPTLGALRERLVAVMEEHLRRSGDERRAPEGEEFHFVSSVSVVVPTPYVAHDLREFVEALRKVSIGSLYFHIFAARLRLQRGENDFSIWLEDSLGEKELAEEVARLDPYSYTLDGLRAQLIGMVEKRLG